MRDQVRERQIERVHTLTYALLLDVVAWFADLREPVDGRLFPEYRLPAAIRDLADPGDRLASYCSGRLLAAWVPARRRWREHGARLRPDLGPSGTLEIEGLDGGRRPLAVARFRDRSVVETDAGPRYLGRDWVVTERLAADLSRIENAAFALARRP